MPRPIRTALIDPDRLRRWAIAVALALGAVALQWSVRPWVGARIPFLFFLPAVVAAAALSGRAAGVFVAAVGFVNAARWLVPDGQRWMGNAADELSLLIYVVFALFLAAIGGRLRVSAARASMAEQRLVLAGEDTGIGIFDIDLIAGSAYLSPALGALAGIDAAGPITTQSLAARLPRELSRQGEAVLAQKLRDRARSYESEIQFPTPEGTPRWLLLRVHIAWSGDRAVRLRGACIDITERKAVDALLDRTQAELSQQVTDLHRLHELSSRLLEALELPRQLGLILGALCEFHGARRGLITLLGEDGDAPAVGASLGFEAEAAHRLATLDGAMGSTVDPGAPPLPDRRRVVGDTEAAGVDPALRHLARENGFRAVHGTALVGQRGQVIGVIAIHFDTPREPSVRERTFADICARKGAIFLERARAQEALEESRGLFRAVLDASAVPFVVLAPCRHQASGPIVDFEWVYVNEAAARALRRPVEGFLGKRVQEVLPQRWATSATFARYVEVVEQGATQEFETRVLYEGRDQWFQCVASPMRGNAALWFVDVTRRKQDEQTLQDADRRKDEFLATLAHELRNPLAPIRQAAAVWRLPQATEAQRRWAHAVIDRQVRHMALLLDDLLDVSRITRGVLTLRRGPYALAEMLEAAVETARPAMDARRHVLEIVVPQAPILMQADALRVSQIVANLLTNAAKYTEPGGSVRLLAALDGDDVLLEVRDNGMGIAPESLPAVFDMFTQLRAGDDGPQGGLGIGLALTKGLVELHGGSISARSDGPGLGSIFTVRLPRGVPTGRLPAAAPDLEPRAAPAARILVADDNRDAAESLAALLELEGHQVTLAFDGEDAIRAYEAARPQVCLLDIGMPYRNGNEVAAAIRQRAEVPAPVLVAITGWGQESDRRSALDAGFDHHLTKPIDPKALVALIEEAGARRVLADTPSA